MITSIEAINVLTGKTLTCEIQPAAIDLAGRKLYLSPGWMDIQINGFAGVNLSEAGLRVEDLQRMNDCLRREGVAAWCPTLVTGPAEVIEANLALIADACRLDPVLDAALLGIHLEGPYISPLDGARGAHPLPYVRPPDWAEFERWQKLAQGRIRLLTLAPEVPGAIEFIRRLAGSGVVVGIGHSLASTETLKAAADAGASLSTHLGNGIAAQLHRHANPLWDQLAEDRLWASLIFDGFHLPPNVMRVFLRAKGIERIVLVSDAVSLARLPAGVYETTIGGKVELHANGRLSLYGTEYLAGSASSLKDCIGVAVRQAGCSLAQAARMAALNPPKVLGVPPPAEWTLFAWDGESGVAEVIGLVPAGGIRD